MGLFGGFSTFMSPPYLWAYWSYELLVALKRHMKDPVLGHKGVMWRPKGGLFNNRHSPSWSVWALFCIQRVVQND